jgi:hypothetical protein
LCLVAILFTFSRSRSAPSRLGLDDTFCGSCHGLLQVSPSASSFRSPSWVGGVVVVEPDLSLPSNAPENPDVRVGHDDPAPSRTTRAACAASSCVAYALDCARLSPSPPRIVQE